MYRGAERLGDRDGFKFSVYILYLSFWTGSLPEHPVFQHPLDKIGHEAADNRAGQCRHERRCPVLSDELEPARVRVTT